MGDTEDKSIGGWVDKAIDDIDVCVAAGITAGASESDLATYQALKARPRGQRAQGAHELDPIKRLWEWSHAKIEAVKIAQQLAKS